MFCSQCGTEIPEEASFCWKCGKQQIKGVAAEEPKWETCEIKWTQMREGLTGSQGWFEADAIAPTGVYVAAQTEAFGTGYNNWMPDQRHAPIQRELVNRLLREGWEPVGDRGPEWWSDRFRRRFTPGSGCNVILLGYDKRKRIDVLKAVRQLTGFELQPAMKLLDTRNAMVLSHVNRAEAEAACKRLEAAGATARIE